LLRWKVDPASLKKGALAPFFNVKITCFAVLKTRHSSRHRMPSSGGKIAIGIKTLYL
jgi:hypothetical protein